MKAATENQQAFATLSKAVTNVGAAHDVAGKSIQSVIDKQAQLKGFSTTDLAQGFTELVDDTHNTAEAFKLLQVSEDAARVAHESDATAAAAVGKAYEGSTNALRQFGIVVTPVKTALEALNDEHVKASLALTTEATQLDKVRNGEEAIAELEARVGGQAGVYAKTAAGQWDILKVSVANLEVELGNQLLPVLDDVAIRVERLATDFTDSARAQQDVRDVGKDVISTLHDIESVAETVGPPLLDIAKAGADIASAIGGPAIVTAFGVIAGGVVVVKAAAAAQTLWAAAIKAGAPAQEGQTASVVGTTAALQGQTVARNNDRFAREPCRRLRGYQPGGDRVQGVAARGRRRNWRC